MLWAGETIKGSGFNDLFFSTLEDKNVESNVDDGGLACDMSEGNRPCCGYLYDIFC